MCRRSESPSHRPGARRLESPSPDGSSGGPLSVGRAYCGHQDAPGLFGRPRPTERPAPARKRRASARSLLETDEAGRSRPEAARLEVERLELRLEVDMEPLAARRVRMLRGQRDEPRSDPLPLQLSPYLRVEQERVVAAVPGDVHEPDRRPVLRPGHDLPQALLTNAIPPPLDGVPAVRAHELDHLRVRQPPAPVICDLRA